MSRRPGALPLDPAKDASLEPFWLLRLMSFMSPAFPTGGFAYSHGLEWAVEAGDLTDLGELFSWISDLLLHGSLWTDCIVLRHARLAPDMAALRELAWFASACAASRERQEETLAQGAAFRRAYAAWRQPDPHDDHACWPLPVAIGHTFRLEAIDEDLGCAAALHAAVANLISAAVRLVPLGQTDGLRAAAALEPVILRTMSASRNATLDDIGGMCVRSDIAAMRHETQSTRLFRT